MKKIIVNRPDDTVEVSIIIDEATNKYRFVNITKGHICKCQFDSIEAAISDLEQYIKKGKVLSYEITNN